jgi:hypothetical protein
VADLICIVHRGNILLPSLQITMQQDQKFSLYSSRHRHMHMISTAACPKLHRRQDSLPNKIARLFTLKRAEVTGDHRIIYFSYYCNWDCCSRTLDGNITAPHWIQHWVRCTQLPTSQTVSIKPLQSYRFIFSQSFKWGFSNRLEFLVFDRSYTHSQTSPPGWQYHNTWHAHAEKSGLEQCLL